MRKNIRRIVILIVAFTLFTWLLKRCNLIPAGSNLFFAKEVKIDNTPILIKEVKSIAELITIAVYDEVVADSIVINNSPIYINPFSPIAPMGGFPSIAKRIVLIGRGKVLAGTNLKLIRKENFSVRNDTITMRLPKAVILDAIMNPSDFETFDEKGTWSNEAVIAVKLKARKKMIDRALKNNILQKADSKAKLVMQNFLKGFGYKGIIIDVY